jgi:aminoglycoside 6-adenylyltransferase
MNGPDPLLSEFDQDPVIAHVVTWAAADPRLRAVVWTSTRSDPAAKVDALSDYDIIFVVDDIAPFLADEGWLGDFGPLLVVYRDPVRTEGGHPAFTRVTQYEDGLKIDFTVMPVDGWSQWAAGPALPDDLDVGYRVLLDKDGLTAHLQPPTGTAYIARPPDEATYREVIELFFHEGTYVAKNLWRDELLPAKYSLDAGMKGEQLRTMLEWRAAIDRDWNYKTGVLGKGLKKALPPELWVAVEATYVGADRRQNWEAFYATIDLFRAVAMDVGDALGYAYPLDLDQRATAYFRDLQALPRDATRFHRALSREE